MTPNELDQYLAVLKKHNVQQAHVAGLMVIFEAQFAGPLPGVEPTPGGWKSPERLDAPDQFAHEVP